MNAKIRPQASRQPNGFTEILLLGIPRRGLMVPLFMSPFLLPEVDNNRDSVEVPEHPCAGYPSLWLAAPRTRYPINLATPMPRPVASALFGTTPRFVTGFIPADW